MKILDRIRAAGNNKKALNLPSGGAVQLPLNDVAITGLSGTIRDVSRNLWFSPLEPIPAIAPPGSKFRQWGMPWGLNINWTPGSEGNSALGVSFEVLRGAAEGWDLLRIGLDTVKDTLCSMPWEIRPKKDVGESELDYKKRSSGDAVLSSLKKFFDRPDGIRPFELWLRRILDDQLVIDAPTIVYERDKSGKIASVPAVDGATIKPLVTDQGFRPRSPDIAYQQILYGLPSYEFTTDEMLWMPRNERTFRLYGVSDVQAILYTIQLGLSRQNFILDYYKEGNMPEGLCFLPPSVPISRVQEAQQWFDTVLAGDLGNRRRLRFLPSWSADDKGSKPSIIFPKEPLLKDELDEWFVKIICWRLGLSPQFMVKQMNRACHSSDTETLTENGWKKYEDIHPDDRIATINPRTGNLEYQKPTKKHVHWFSGEMIHFKNHVMDTLVTPEHDMWMRIQSNSAAYRKIKASKASGRRVLFSATPSCEWNEGQFIETFKLPDVPSGYSKLTVQDVAAIRAAKGKMTHRALANVYGVSSAAITRLLNTTSAPQRSSIIVGPTVNMDAWLEFLGYFLSEGGLSHQPKHYLLTLSQKKEPTASNISKCLSKLPFVSQEYPRQKDGMRRWNVYGKVLCQYLMQNTGGYCDDKKIPREFLNLPSRQLRILFDALMAGDGSWGRWKQAEISTSGSYASTSKQLASDVQELAIKLGYSASVKPHQDKRAPRKKSWIVLICNRKEYWIGKQHSVKTHYEGPVYCFTVPNGLFITRRNGKVSIHGNSAQTSVETAEEEGLMPKASFIALFINEIIGKMGFSERYEFAWGTRKEVDPVKQAQIDEIYIQNGTLVRNEVRERLGQDPLPQPEANIPGMLGQHGFIPLSMEMLAQSPVFAQQSNNGDDDKDPSSGGGTQKIFLKRLSLTMDYADWRSRRESDRFKAINPACCDPIRKGWQHALLQGTMYNLWGPLKILGADPDAVIAEARAFVNRSAVFVELPAQLPAASLKKSKRIKITGGHLTPESSIASAQMTAHLHNVFVHQRTRAKEKIKQLMKSAESDLLKTGFAPENISKSEIYAQLRKNDEDSKQVADELFNDLKSTWDSLVDASAQELERAGSSGVTKGALELSYSDGGGIASANQSAILYAKKRAAEMVGMKVVDGSLVENPNAKWAISDTTRADLQRIIKNAFEQETDLSDVISQIGSAGAFSEQRAEMIARTEVSMAQNRGNYDIWKQTGVVDKMIWTLSEDHDDSGCVCEDNDDVTVDFGQPFPDGSYCPPAHPACECAAYATVVSADDEE